MSGLPEHGYPAFVAAETKLRERGYNQILNPINHSNGVGTELPYDFYIRESIADVLKAQAICVLPLWEKSKGARLEVHTASVLGLPVYTLQELLQTERDPETLLLKIDVGPFYVFR